MGHRWRWLGATTLGVAAALCATVISAAPLPGPASASADGSNDGSTDGTIDHVVVYEPDDTADGHRAARPERVVARLDPAEVARLEADPTVAHVEPDHRYELATSTPIPGDAAPRDGDASGVAVQLEPPWGLDRIDQRPPTPLSGTFAPRTSGDGVTVYVVDDGVDPGHPDFGGRVGSGWTGVHDGGDDTECGGHGSHVAGTVAGAEYGVAKQARIVPVRVINCSGWTSLSTLLDALDWILEDHRPGDPAVVNLSMGGPPSAALADALAVLDERGIVVVAAAGNGATDACTSSPADAPTAIAVGATDVSDARAHFSNWGTCVDLFAPGVAIRSVGPSSGDEVRSGTSMAAPHVAGAAALLLADAPTSTPDEVRERLSSGATTGAVTDRGPGSPDRLLHVRPASDGPSDEPGSGSEDVASLAPPGTRFVAGVPERVLDTRPVGRMLAGSVVEVGVGSSSVMSRSGSVSGVVLNVTVVDPVAAGFVSVFPCGAGVPEASNANFEAGATVATAVVSGVGPSGDVCVFSSVDAHVLVDLAGVLTAGFVGRSPERVADTRSGPVVTAGTVVPIDVRAPAEATAVVATVTAVDPDAAGHLTVFACGPDGRDPVPTSSSLNFAAGRTVANAVVSAVGPDGHLCVIASADTHVLVDVSGWSTSGVSGHWPERVLDTRSQGRVAGGSVVEAGVAASPTVASGASAVVLNLTVVDPVAAGFVTVFPCGGAVPDASNVNFEAGATVANAVVSAVGGAGDVCVFASADAHVLVDAVGAVS